MTHAQVLRRLAALPSQWLSREERDALASGAAALDAQALLQRQAEDTRPLAPERPQEPREPSDDRR